jgi:2-oxo-4-hydroxy-4-carboxy--5-ureidoimidazoline (OHCU) decarboxylase
VPVAGAARIDDVDALDADAFVAALGPLFEGAPRFLARLAAARPFGTAAALFDAARAIALAMPEPDQVELLDAHPRIGAAPGSISALSRREQGYAQVDGAAGSALAPASSPAEPELDPPGFARPPVESPTSERPERGGSTAMSPTLAGTLETLNDAYEGRFGFRFVVFVAGRPREAIVPELERRLQSSRDAEIRVGLGAVIDIARDRWRTLGGEEEDS